MTCNEKLRDDFEIREILAEERRLGVELVAVVEI